MHKLFADWYRQADLNASAEVLNTRWDCVEAALKKLDVDAIVQLTRVCFSLPKPGGGSGETDGAAVALTFKEADVSFPMKGNAQLLSILFGVTLAQAIEADHSLATAAALAVTSAHCAGLVAAPSIEELVAIAQQYLAKHGSSKRSNALVDPVIPPKFGKLEVPQSSTVDIQDAQNQSHWPQVHQNFENLKVWVLQVNAAIEALTVANAKTRAEIATAFKANADRAALESRIKVLKEEADVLWWLFGEYSNSLKKAWRDGEASEFCIVIGREFAELMAFYEPSSNTDSFLSKALSRVARAGDALCAKQVLDGGSPEWRDAVVAGVRAVVQRTGGVTPLHTGLVTRQDFSSRWVERLSEVSALRPEQQLTPVQWALQACHEALLLDWMEKKSG